MRFFKKHEKGRAFPASDGNLGRFVSTLADEGLKYGTVRGYLSGVRAAQLDRGFDVKDIRQRHRLWSTLQGIRRFKGDSSKPKQAISLKMLKKFSQEVTRLRKCNPASAMYWGAIWAAILVGFFGMLRKDNLTTGKVDASNKQNRRVCEGTM